MLLCTYILAFGWLTDQIEEFAIPGVVALVVMLLAVVGLVTCGKRRKKKWVAT